MEPRLDRRRGAAEAIGGTAGLRQSNNVGLQFSQLPQKRRWRKPGLVERRRNDFQKLNSICLSETSVFGEA